jgi:hypothetical protein
LTLRKKVSALKRGTQLLSNIAQVSRLELVLRVLQRGVAGLAADRQAIWRQEQAAYLGKQPRHICYRLKSEEVPGYLQETGELLMTLLLLTSIQTASNNTDDSQLLAQSLSEQAERGHKVEKATVDEGYTEPTAEAACVTHGNAATLLCP